MCNFFIIYYLIAIFPSNLIIFPIHVFLSLCHSLFRVMSSVLVMSLCLISLSCLHVSIMLSFYVSPVCIVLSCMFSQAHYEYLPLPLCPSVSVSSLLNVSALPLFVFPPVVSQVRLVPMCIPSSQLLCQVVLISLLSLFIEVLVHVSPATCTIFQPLINGSLLFKTTLVYRCLLPGPPLQISWSATTDFDRYLKSLNILVCCNKIMYQITHSCVKHHIQLILVEMTATND